MSTQVPAAGGSASPALVELRGLVRDANARTAPGLPEVLDASSPLVRSTLEDLASEAAFESLRANSYWPKWDSPRWRMLLLREMGLADLVPPAAVDALAQMIDRRCLHFFPLGKAEIPPEPRPPYLCHCNLASVCLLLGDCGRDLDGTLGWAIPWLLRYQLSDGGLNCNPEAYRPPAPHGSFTCTIAALEAVLLAPARPWTPQELAFLERGARYLLRRRLCRSFSQAPEGTSPPLLELIFPRFYHYDMLRGLSFVTLWSERTGNRLQAGDLLEVLQTLLQRLDAHGALASRADWPGCEPSQPGHREGDSKALLFPLLERVSVPGAPSPYLTREWRQALDRLERLDRAGLLD